MLDRRTDDREKGWPYRTPGTHRYSKLSPRSPHEPYYGASILTQLQNEGIRKGVQQVTEQPALEDMDALGLAHEVSSGSVSPEELLDDALQRIAAVNPSINAVVSVLEEEARAALKRGLPEGPFRGVPFLVKDLKAQVEGVLTTGGSNFLAATSSVADHDTTTVARYRRAGLLIVGKTNTPEFGCSPTTEPTLHGPSRNPWDLDRSPGGSSGGAAAAIAAGIVPAAHGSDGGGSIRIPASCCGLFGFKPTRGRVPTGPRNGESWNGLATEHALTRSVRDSAALLDAVSGGELGDPYAAPPQPDSYLDDCQLAPGRLRIAVAGTPASGVPVADECRAALDDAVKLLTELGHEVSEASPTYDVEGLGAAYRLVLAANMAAIVDEHAELVGREPQPGELEPVIANFIEEARGITGPEMTRALWTVQRTGRAVAPFFEKYDIMLSPTTATPAPLLGHLDMTTEDVDGYLSKLFAYIPYTTLANVVGAPAMSVPLYWTSEDLPVGVHAQAAFGRDDVLFRLASQLERARPWLQRRPPMPEGRQPT